MIDSLYPVFWILGTLLLYTAAGLFLVLVLEGGKYRSPGLVLLSLASLVPSVLVLKLLDLPAPVKYFGALVMALVGLLVSFLLVPRRIRDWRRIKQRKEHARKTTLHLVLLTGSAVFIMPFIWLVTTSFKEEDQIFKYPPIWIPTQQVKFEIRNPSRHTDGIPPTAGKSETNPKSEIRNPKSVFPLSTLELDGQVVRVGEIAELEDGRKKVLVLPGQPHAGETLLVERSKLTKIRRFGLKWENYTDALDFLPEETHKGLLYLWNTVYMTALRILGTLLSSSLVAYSFARLRWPGRDVLFIVLLSTMMLPGAVTMIPVYLIFRGLGWIDTLKPLWVPSFFAGAFSVFLLRQFFMTIPLDLEDAAKIDGCSYFGIYWRIMLPLIKPALAALTIMAFMGSWNDFMGPLIYINSPEKMPLSYALVLFQGAHLTEFGLLMAASTLVMLPVLIVFFFTQRYFIQGITLTGLKQ